MQVSCSLCLLNLMLLMLNPVFADERRQLEHSLKNMDVMKKQVRAEPGLKVTSKVISKMNQAPATPCKLLV